MATNKLYKMNKESEQIGANELIFQLSGGKIYSGGFTVNSELLRGGIAPMSFLNNNNNNSSDSEKPSGVFGESGSYVIPPLFFKSLDTETQRGGATKNNYNYEDERDSEIIGEDLHDKLLQIAEAKTNRKKGTAKILPKTSKNTTKNKKVN
jgi:hypothetical protein